MPMVLLSFLGQVVIEGERRNNCSGQYDQICNAQLPRALDPYSVPSEELSTSLGNMVELINLVHKLAALALHNSGQVLGNLLFELLSEALGLKPDHLKDMDYAKGHLIFCYYYPSCLELELTMGTKSHTDLDFLTFLLQYHVGGLQVLVQNH
ncbi:hypothetical protein JHK87_000571 [Glycine soja]|nr:hypothetical protein JHK87_000571 [Glycine soja]